MPIILVVPDIQTAEAAQKKITAKQRKRVLIMVTADITTPKSSLLFIILKYYSSNNAKIHVKNNRMSVGLEHKLFPIYLNVSGYQLLENKG